MMGEDLSQEERPVTAHLVEVSFDLSDSEEERDFKKAIQLLR